jgi:hypothetical protein
VVSTIGGATMTVALNGTFTDPGATANDTCAGVLPVTTIGSVNVNATGTYSLTYTATDPSGNSSASGRIVYVIDESIPTITQQPTGQTNEALTRATFTVSATSPSPFGYQWNHAGVNLANGGRISGSTSAALTISLLTNSDAGSYSVVVTNAYGAVTSSVVTLKFIAQPSAAFNCTLINGTYHFEFTGTPSAGYSVWASSVFSNWVRIGTSSEDSAGHYEFNDPTTANYPMRFYKVQWP